MFRSTSTLADLYRLNPNLNPSPNLKPNPNLNPNRLKKTKVSLQLFLIVNFDRVNGPENMCVWKGRRFKNILKLDRDLR